MQQEPEKNRYSDEELAEFKNIIEHKIEEATKQLNDLQEQLTELNESGETSKAGTFEEGASNWQREHINKLAARQQRFIRDLEHALIRIRNKTYGVCAVTGKLIDKKRLMVVPHATKSVEGKTVADEKTTKKTPSPRIHLNPERNQTKKVLNKAFSKKSSKGGDDSLRYFDEDDDLGKSAGYDDLGLSGYDD